MVAADHDGSLGLSCFSKMVDVFAESRAFAVAQPADSRRQTLKPDLLACEMNPSVEDFVFGKKLQHEVIRKRNVARVARQRGPAEWSAPFGKHRPDIGGTETGEVLGIRYAALRG